MDDFDYDLPESRIAQYPLKERDSSKLLVYRNGSILEGHFSEIEQYLPEGCLMVFNNTRVFRARLLFRKPGGARIEIFCLEPSAGTGFHEALMRPGESTWKCLVGNLKRWKSGELVMDIQHGNHIVRLTARLYEILQEGQCLVHFTWDPGNIPFGDILEMAGKIPLPPYIHREAEESDNDRYQTIYASPAGSVAAPTAGLHFTPELTKQLKASGIRTEEVTLHVGLGTFRPVTAARITEHVMHHERIMVEIQLIEALIEKVGRDIVAVGTTAARTLESVYWAGCLAIENPGSIISGIPQWIPYSSTGKPVIPARKALEGLLAHLRRNGLDRFETDTSLIIVPGYRYRIVTGLVTNFHMPRSTLLLLVAALAGSGWRDTYTYALSNGFRFLSYGDACLYL